ncbi:MAG: nicotinate (nicotinamide) nucleotide adenylyltransferase [candidate division Zixibacteria bacterium RBG_16_53_22]|nr:MAG: nicotinate (nicotinamide) nucleotide adenylyltransferase [candidate division Zixibacteria bacterium RBG_16_53_22]
MARVGILGGTFDPPHNGHIAIARAALDQLRLSKIIFVPARIQPHKILTTTAPAEARLDMLRLALDGDDAFEISDIELRRNGPSYTVDTLEEFRQERPHDDFFLIIGADNISEIETWHNPGRIFELATVAAANRPNFTPSGKYMHAIVYFSMTPTDISSTEIRERIAGGRPISEMLPSVVEEYIKKNGLYSNV